MDENNPLSPFVGVSLGFLAVVLLGLGVMGYGGKCIDLRQVVGVEE